MLRGVDVTLCVWWQHTSVRSRHTRRHAMSRPMRTPFRLVSAACVAALVARSRAVAGAQAPQVRGHRRSGHALRRRSRGGSWSSCRSPRSPSRGCSLRRRAPALFAIDLDQLRAGQPAIVDAKRRSAIRCRSRRCRPGDYYAQAIVNVVRAHEAGGRQDDLGALQRRHAGGHADRRAGTSTATCRRSTSATAAP